MGEHFSDLCLKEATLLGQADLVKLLLEETDANIHLQDCNGRCPLHLATRDGLHRLSLFY
jgi:ankyrin repeat protein